MDLEGIGEVSRDHPDGVGCGGVGSRGYIRDYTDVYTRHP